MDKSLIDKYKEDMMRMYRSSKNAVAVNNPDLSETVPQAKPDTANTTGELVVIVTTVRSLYPLQNAKVTVFEGDLENKRIIDSGFTDQSGRTKAFILDTPKKSISLDLENTELPYGVYSVEINAEGYIDTFYLNIPVFSDTTSIQRTNMMLIETEGKNKGPIIYDTSEQYELN